MRKFLEKKSIALYEPLLSPLLSGLRKKVLTHVYKHVDIYAQQKAHTPIFFLDCCCGAGGLLRLATHHHTQNISFMGLDAHALMLQEARKNASKSFFLQANAVHIPLTTQSVHIATLCMALHTMPLEIRQGVIHELLRVAKKVIVADYCLAERNIHLPSAFLAHAVERLIGGEHYAQYKHFMQQGALEGFLYTQGLQSQERYSVLGGAGQVSIMY